MPVNTAKLLAELRHLTIHPEKWDQGLWVKVVQKERPSRASACGSFGCLAGNTVLHEGFELDWYGEVSRVYERDAEGAIVYEKGQAVSVLDEDGVPKVYTEWLADVVIVSIEKTEPIEDVAAKELGLNSYQADLLFSGDRTEAELWELAQNITLGEIDDWDYQEAREDRDELARENAQAESS
jgi:hypothetical protein